jgi:rsbT co-antagonist protein RsbR
MSQERTHVAWLDDVFKNSAFTRGGSRVPGTDQTNIAELLSRNESDIISDWMRAQLADARRSHLLDERELRQQSAEFLGLLRGAVQNGAIDDITGREWDTARRMLDDLSRSRARLGLTPTQTATFLFSLKEPLFTRIRREFANDPASLADATLSISKLLDKLGLYVTEVFQKGREEVIHRQQQEMLELSTPVVELWDGVLALPLIGTLDSARTQVVMENLLQRIVDTGSGIAIIDITGVPTVDTLVAQHLLKTVAAARLMGADCIISGIRPQIAQTIVHLGVDLQDVVTKATLADAFAVALRRLGLGVEKVTFAGPRAKADARGFDQDQKA